MERQITEKELIECIGYENYKSFALNVYELIKKSDSYKNMNDVLFNIGVHPLDDTTWLHFEATLKKMPFGDDFGFTRMVITDDFDFVLDRINDAKQVINK